MTKLIKWEWDMHDNRTFSALQLILKFSLKEKNHSKPIHCVSQVS